MFTPIYFIIGVFAVGSVTFAVLGAQMDRQTPVTPVPAQPAQLKKAA